MRFSNYVFAVRQDKERAAFLFPFLKGMKDGNGNKITLAGLEQMEFVKTGLVPSHVFAPMVMAKPVANAELTMSEEMEPNLKRLLGMVSASQRCTEDYLMSDWNTQMTADELLVFWKTIQGRLSAVPAITNVIYDAESATGFIVAESQYVTEFDVKGTRDGSLFSFDPDDGFRATNKQLADRLNEEFRKSRGKDGFVLPYIIPSPLSSPKRKADQCLATPTAKKGSQ